MSDPVNIPEFIKTKIRPQADFLLKAHAKQTEKLSEITFALDPDIEKKNLPMLRLHIKALEAMVAEIANHLSRTAYLLNQLDGLEPDQNLVGGLREIEKVTGELSELQRKLNKNFGIAKQMLGKANAALEASEAKGDDTETRQQWALLEAWLRKTLDVAKKRLDQMVVVRARAEKAVAGRDEKELAEAIKASAALVDAKPGLDDLREIYEGFCKKCKIQDLPRDQQDQLGRDRKEFEQMVEEVSAMSAKIVALDVAIEAMEIPPPDVKKAAAVLKIPSSAESKLKKAMEAGGVGMLKALDALAKELKLKTSGKDMLAALKTANLI